MTALRTDAHLHLWDLHRSSYTWLDGLPALRRSGRWQDVREPLRALGVRRVVLVQADDTAEDTILLQETAARIEQSEPDMRADVVGHLPLPQPDRVAAALEDPAATEHLVGVRNLIHDHPDAGLLETEPVRASLDLLSRAGLPLDVPDAFPRHLEQAVRVADRHPELTLVLDHLGKPPLGDPAALEVWERGLRALAARPRTVAKLSGLATSGTGDPGRVIDVALDAFGPDRLLIGSDWPIAPVPFDLASGMGGLLERVGRESAAVQEQLWAGTADRVYRRSSQRP